jgi:hypothetical protein
MRRRSSRWWRAGQTARLGTLALSIGIASGGALPGSTPAADVKPAPGPAQGQVVSAGTLEKTYGIRIAHLAVTGGGGLVDLRFTVLDPAKARLLFPDHARPPRLVVEGSGAELEAPHHGAMRNVRLQKDAASFLLYPNARGAVRTGSRVALVFGNVSVEPLVAQ